MQFAIIGVMPRKQAEQQEPTVYDRPSEKYPDMSMLGIARARQTTLRALLGTLRTRNAERREAERLAAEAYQRVVAHLEKCGIEVREGPDNGVRFWCDVPWTIYRGSSSRLNASKLLALGVSAELIEQATTKAPHDAVTIRAVEEQQ